MKATKEKGMEGRYIYRNIHIYIYNIHRRVNNYCVIDTIRVVTLWIEQNVECYEKCFRKRKTNIS